MSSIIKAIGCFSDAVLIVGGHTRRFSPAYPGPVEEQLSPADAVQETELESAKEKADRIVAEAEARAESILKEATSRGYFDGRTEGFKAADEQCRERILEIAELAKNATIDREQMIHSAQQELSALALAVAAKVIHREVSTDPAVVLSMVESALRRIPTESQVRILVSPGELDFVREQWAAVAATAPVGLDAEIVGDERVGRAGCIVESREGRVDGRVETQLARIAESFEVDR